jgi:hypothetical protein
MLLVDADRDAASVHLRHVHRQQHKARALGVEPAHDLEDLSLRPFVGGLDDLRIAPERTLPLPIEQACNEGEQSPDQREPHQQRHRPRQETVRRVRLSERVDVTVGDLHNAS